MMQNEEVIGRVQTAWRNEQVVLTLPDGTEFSYTLEQCEAMYTTFHQQRRFLVVNDLEDRTKIPR